MAQLTQWTRSNIREVQEEMLEELGIIAKKYGLTINPGGATSDSNTCTFKFKATVAEEHKDMSMYRNLGFPPIGTKFTSNYKTFTICDYAPSRPKYPIIAECNGRRFKFSESTVRLLMKAS